MPKPFQYSSLQSNVFYSRRHFRINTLAITSCKEGWRVSLAYLTSPSDLQSILLPRPNLSCLLTTLCEHHFDPWLILVQGSILSSMKVMVASQIIQKDLSADSIIIESLLFFHWKWSPSSKRALQQRLATWSSQGSPPHCEAWTPHNYSALS